MYEFLENNKIELAERCREKVASRPNRSASDQQLKNGVPLFLSQLIRTLKIEQTDEPMKSRKISGPSDGEVTSSEVGVTAALHGKDLLLLGYSVNEVVHDYGDICQAITDLAFERDAPFQVDEFRTLNRCLDNAIAEAVTEFSYQRDYNISGKQAIEENKRIGYFAHELRNFLNTASLSFSAAKAGNLDLSGATGRVLERSLLGLRLLIDRSVEDVRGVAENPRMSSLFSVADFVRDMAATGNLASKIQGCAFIVAPVDPHLAICGNQDLLFSAIWNILQNAFKFTNAHTEVTLNAYANGDRILIEVKDHCGGLPPGMESGIFSPFTQKSDDKTGLGLGLSIAQQCILDNDGNMEVKNIPGVGCVFTVSLPRYKMDVETQVK